VLTFQRRPTNTRLAYALSFPQGSSMEQPEVPSNTFRNISNTKHTIPEAVLCALSRGFHRHSRRIRRRGFPARRRPRQRGHDGTKSDPRISGLSLRLKAIDNRPCSKPKWPSLTAQGSAREPQGSGKTGRIRQGTGTNRTRRPRKTPRRRGPSLHRHERPTASGVTLLQDRDRYRRHLSPHQTRRLSGS